MKKIILSILLLLSANTAFAEKYPVKIMPAQIIATCHDEIETGDKIKFTTINDVYKNNSLYIKAGTPVIGKVDYIDENGWVGDNAEILLKKFKTKDINGNSVVIKSNVTINGFEELKDKNPKIQRFFHYLSAPIRGKEVEIIPSKDTSTFTLWLEY